MGVRIDYDGVIVLASQTVGGAAVTTSAIPCFGAVKVAFLVTAADANQLAAASVIQVSNDGTNWVATQVAGVSQDVAFTNTLSGGVLNTGGRMVVLSAHNGEAGTATAEGIMWRFARLTMVRSAADVTGVVAKAFVFS